MDAQPVEPAICACLAEHHNKLKEAEQVAKAAQACAEAGSVPEAVRVCLDLEQLIYDGGRLQAAAALLARLSRPIC